MGNISNKYSKLKNTITDLEGKLYRESLEKKFRIDECKKIRKYMNNFYVTKELEDIKLNECKVCFEHIISADSLWICGHRSLCLVCYKKIKKCPICRCKKKLKIINYK